MLFTIEIEDIKKCYDWYKSGEYNTFFRHFPDHMNIEEFYTFISSRKCYSLEGKGLVTLSIDAKPRIASFAIIIDNDHQKSGLCLEGIVELSRTIFNQGFLRLATIVSDTDNRSKELLSKGGFIEDGKSIDSCFYDNKLHDEIRFSLTSDKFFEKYGG